MKLKDHWVLISMAALLCALVGFGFLVANNSRSGKKTGDSELSGTAKSVWTGRKGDRMFTENVIFKVIPRASTVEIDGGVAVEHRGTAGTVMVSDLDVDMSPSNLKARLGGGEYQGNTISKTGNGEVTGFVYVGSYLIRFSFQGSRAAEMAGLLETARER